MTELNVGKLYQWKLGMNYTCTAQTTLKSKILRLFRKSTMPQFCSLDVTVYDSITNKVISMIEYNPMIAMYLYLSRRALMTSDCPAMLVAIHDDCLAEFLLWPDKLYIPLSFAELVLERVGKDDRD